MYENENVEVKKSSIEGYGLFAKRVFKKGEIVLSWSPKVLSELDFKNIPESEKKYINTVDDGTRVLMSIPERFVNHSDSPNTLPKGKTDVAVREILQGEEITSSYDFTS